MEFDLVNICNYVDDDYNLKWALPKEAITSKDFIKCTLVLHIQFYLLCVTDNDFNEVAFTFNGTIAYITSSYVIWLIIYLPYTHEAPDWRLHFITLFPRYGKIQFGAHDLALRPSPILVQSIFSFS